MGWELSQNSQVYGPKVTLTISPQGFKWFNQQTHLTIVSAAPEWKVSVYSDKTNALYSTPMDKFHGVANGSFSFVAQQIVTNTNLVNDGQGKAFDWKVQFYKVPETEQPSELHDGDFRNRIDKGTYAVALCPVPKQVSDLVGRCYNLPAAPGIPLRFDYVNDENHKEVLLRTISVKTIKVTPATFTPPRGLRVVKTDREVVLDSEGKEGMDQWLRVLDDPREHKPAAQHH